jgi:hypothetical protein
MSVPPVDGRWPTARELRNVLGDMSGVRVDWQTSGNGPEADLSSGDGRHTTLRITDYLDEDSPCQPYFSKGSPELVTQAVLALASQTGPLVIYPDTGANIQVVFNGQVISDPTEQP